MKDFNDPIPNRLPIENLFDGNTLAVRCFSAMQPVNYISQFFNGSHTVASSSSLTLQNEPVTPAAIAGVQRRVL